VTPDQLKAWGEDLRRLYTEGRLRAALDRHDNISPQDLRRWDQTVEACYAAGRPPPESPNALDLGTS
jgi:hypothetical protein